MAAIPAPDDRLEYNGFRFPDSFTTTTVTAKNIYDASGRTVSYTQLTIKAKSKIVEGADQDVMMDAIRTALERSGGQLFFTGKGYDIELNAPGKPRDLRWGPKPQVLEWKTFGAGRAAEISWMVECAINNCDNAAWQNRIMEYTYTLSFSTDEAGYTTKTHTGSITIPMTRNNVNAAGIPDSADNYFDNVVPPALPNFKRTISRTLNEAKDKLSFTVTDTEQAGNPLPPGVINADASHEHNSQPNNKAIFIAWTGTISASYEVVKGKPRSDCMPIFLKLVKSRQEAERAGGFFMIPLSMRIAEPQIYGRQAASFSLTYSLTSINAKDVSSRYATGGLWQRTGDDWNVWATSVALARANRGLAGLRHLPAAEVLVDLCLNGSSGFAGGGLAPFNPIQGNQRVVAPSWNEIKKTLGVPDQINPLSSWQNYECRLVVEPVDHIVVHKPLPTGPMPNPLQLSPAANFVQGFFSGNSNSFFAAPQVSPPTIIQSTGSTDLYIRLVGRAVRVGHEIPPPTMISVGGFPVVSANHPSVGTYFSTWTASYTTHPIQAAEWNLRWFVSLPPGALGIQLVSPPRPDEPNNVNSGTVR